MIIVREKKSLYVSKKISIQEIKNTLAEIKFKMVSL